MFSLIRNHAFRHCTLCHQYRLKNYESTTNQVNFTFEVPTSDFYSIFAHPAKSSHCTTTTNTLNIPVEESTQVNSLNIQMLSLDLREQIFGNNRLKVDSGTLQKAMDELNKFGLGQKTEFIPDVNLKIPTLEGANIEEHFYSIGNAQAGPYRDILKAFIKSEIVPIPCIWLKTPGWTKYEPNKEPVSVPYPDDKALVLDVEVCCKIGETPILATAMSSTAWYGWVSSYITEKHDPPQIHHYTPNMFLPLEGKKRDISPRIVVGHNVAYDRARVKEQYFVEQSGVRFMDTMSMHVCVGGITSFQRAQLKTKSPNEDDEPWREWSSLNSLKEIYKFYCDGILDKDTRNIFVEGTLSDVKKDFNNLMTYCAGDVVATFRVLQKLLPLFLERFPHPVTLAGMLEMGTAYLPVNENWERYILDSEQTYDDLEMECRFLLARKSDQACKLQNEEKFREDLWMWDENWSVQELKLTKRIAKKVSTQEETENMELDELEKKFQELMKTTTKLPVNIPHLPGYPLWYRKLCEKPGDPNWVPGTVLISTGVKVTPKILKLTWEGFPLHYTREYGWGILVADLNADGSHATVPYEKLKKLTLEHGVLERKNIASDVEQAKGSEFKSGSIWVDHVVDGCCHFLKLPHKEGAGNNVGNPLARDFLKTFSKSVLAGSDAAAERVLEIGRMLSYWRNNRDRITGQLVCWLGKNSAAAIVPQVVVSGTLTRRAMERTWLTASNAQRERVGSELRAIVHAPPGYHIVGADVDSQELWIAAVLGDAATEAKTHGATPFGWMTISGNKNAGTDMHSVTAAAAGISRDHAKVINYARIYGAGVRFAQRLLKQFNPSMTDSEANAKASKMFSLTKGRRVYTLKEEFKMQLPDDIADEHSSYSATRIAKILGKPIETVFHSPKWLGGTESTMFNRLEAIANSPAPSTPFLGARLSRAIEYPRDAFLPTRINWVVQSGAADFLHLMLVCIRWLSHGRMRFSLSFHDEVRYLVPSELRYEAALVLHITNLLTRAFCVHRLGLRDLPMAVAFFSSVEIDKVLRKDASNDCVTPSNPHGLSRGYGVPPGEALDIYKTIEKTQGNITRINKPKAIRKEKTASKPKRSPAVLCTSEPPESTSINE